MTMQEGIDEIKEERGVMRQIAMEIFCLPGGIKGGEIGEMMRVDYSIVP